MKHKDSQSPVNPRCKVKTRCHEKLCRQDKSRARLGTAGSLSNPAVHFVQLGCRLSRIDHAAMQVAEPTSKDVGFAVANSAGMWLPWRLCQLAERAGPDLAAYAHTLLQGFWTLPHLPAASQVWGSFSEQYGLFRQGRQCATRLAGCSPASKASRPSLNSHACQRLDGLNTMEMTTILTIDISPHADLCLPKGLTCPRSMSGLWPGLIACQSAPLHPILPVLTTFTAARFYRVIHRALYLFSGAVLHEGGSLLHMLLLLCALN